MKNILYQESIVEIKHLFRMMRNTLLALFVFAGTAFATESYSQTMKVTVVADNMSTGKVISEIEKQTDYLFVYNVNEVNLKRNVKVNAQNKSVAEVLNKVFEGTDIYYAMEGKNIMLMSKAKDGEVAQQANKVTGIVKDTNGEPIIGANVTVKGQSIGTITDIDGRFVLDAPKDAVLQITYIGYVSQEVKVSGKKEFTIVLKEDTKTLDEVVVVGFGTQKKSDLVDAISMATAKELEARPVSSALEALQGLVPGLNISIASGQVLDESTNISVRGTGTIGKGSNGSPLILIDGMEGDITTINPQDIENVTVLKDAASSSIYGARAPFGVIMVTTKSGTEGKTTVNYNNSFRLGSPINLPSMMDSYSFANLYNEATINGGGKQYFSDEQMQKMLDFQSGKITYSLEPDSGNPNIWGGPSMYGFANTDWYKEVYKDKNIFSHEHNLSASGGGKKMNYYISANYLNQNGLLRITNDGKERYTLNGKINAFLTDWLKIKFNSRFARTESFGPSAQQGTTIGMSWPNAPVYDPLGHPSGTIALGLVDSEGGESRITKDQHYYQLGLTFEPIKNWITNVELNYSILQYNKKKAEIACYEYDVHNQPTKSGQYSKLEQKQRKEDYLNLNIYSEYSYSFNNAHNLKLMGGFQMEEMKEQSLKVQKAGLLIDELPEFDLSTGVDGNGEVQMPSISGNSQRWATVGFFGRLNYDYKGKYLIKISTRYDGSSRFRRENRWVLSPSFSAGWNVARENFWNNLQDKINTFKLRISYGSLANQNTSDWYPTYRLMELGLSNGGWLQDGTKPNTATIGGLISSTLTWEKVKSWNAGFDLGMFNNRFNASFDTFVRYTKDMVGPAILLPSTLGTSVPNANNCDLRTKGWELSVTWRDHLNNGLNYGITLNLSDQITIIDKYPGNDGHKISVGNNSSFIEGRRIGEIWGYETIGIAKSQAEMDAHLASLPNGGQRTLAAEWKAGDIMYKDLNGDGKISSGAGTLEDHGDLKYLGDNQSHYLFGIDINADWKGFDFRCFFQGVLKHNVWQSDGYFWGAYNNVWKSYGMKEHADYFRDAPVGLPGQELPANLNSYYPRPIFGSDNKRNQQCQSRYLLNASYIRLKNLQLGYTLPNTWVSKLGIDKCRVFVSGENLWTGTSLSDLFDPETVTTGSGNAYPLSKTWSFGLSLTL